MRHLSRLLLLLVVAGLAPSSARAFTFTSLGTQAGNPASNLFSVGITAADAGQSFDISWGITSPVSISASGTVSVLSFSSSSITLGVSLTNTTNLQTSGLSNAAILSLGLGVTPDPTSKSLVAGSVFDSLGTGSGAQKTFPGGFKGIDACVYGSNGCSGGDIKDGLQAGASDSFQLTLGGDWSNGTTLSFFAIKFQTSAGSYELPGTPGGPVPEPTAALVFGLGALVVRYGVRERRG
jgi:hypothetical protein